MATLLIVEGLTGSLLAYRADLTRWLAADQYASAPYRGAPRLDLATLAQCAERSVAPRAAVAYLFNTDEGRVTLHLRPLTNPGTGKPYPLDRPTIALDPWTGQEIAPARSLPYWRVLTAAIMPFAYDLHTTLTFGATGAVILGVTALCWTVDSLWAFYLTLPRGRRAVWRRWRMSWSIKWPASMVRLNFDVHRAGGLWFWVLLFVFAWSSVFLTLPAVYDRVTHAISDYEDVEQLLSRLPDRPREIPKLGWRDAIAAGDRIAHQLATREHVAIVKPLSIAYFEANDLYSYSVTTNRRFPQFSELNVYLDADTGQLLRSSLPAGAHAGNTITNWLYALHLVRDPVEHWSYRLLVCIVGIVTTLLSVTGIYIWWQKRAARRWARRRQAVSDAATAGSDSRTSSSSRIYL